MPKPHDFIKQVISPAQVEKLKRDSIVVKRGDHVTISYQDERYKKLFYLVEIKDFESLQALRYIPSRISEEELTAAMRNDDYDFYKLTSAAKIHPRHNDCGCGGGAQASNIHRKEFNFHLAELLSKAYERRMMPEDGRVKKVYTIYNWFRNFRLPVLPVWVFPQDVEVAEGATLTLLDCDGLHADNIKLYKNSKLEFGNSYVKINCNYLIGDL